MKSISKLLAGLILVATSIAAGATPLVDTFTGNVTVTPTTPYSFPIDITDDAVVYDPILNQVNSATLVLHLTDSDGNNEKYTINVGTNGTQLVGVSVANSGTTDVPVILSAADVQDLSIDGILSIFLSVSQQGSDNTPEYFFVASTLNADIGLRNANNTVGATVPEPASLGLFGITLLGFGAARKRKQK